MDILWLAWMDTQLYGTDTTGGQRPSVTVGIICWFVRGQGPRVTSVTRERIA